MLKEALLYEKLEDNKVHCFLCAHHCRINPSHFGFCGVRENREGELYTHAYGETIAAGVDPIEKKPLNHFYPGSRVFSVATPGCNFKCGFCQNWRISQATPEDGAGRSVKMSPAEIVEQAQARNCRSIAYTYTEPTIFFEYALDTARLAHREGLANIFVTNGYMTGAAAEKVAPYLAAANVDLKYFDDEKYQNVCRGNLQPVLDTIERLKKLGIWVEVTTLIIPGDNDSDEELTNIADFIAGVDPSIPWHISAFHPNYKYRDHRATTPAILQRGAEIGKKAGIRYIYKGNVAGDHDTYCYSCGEKLIGRSYFGMAEHRIKDGKCPNCGASIDGIFE